MIEPVQFDQTLLNNQLINLNIDNAYDNQLFNELGLQNLEPYTPAPELQSLFWMRMVENLGINYWKNKKKAKATGVELHGYDKFAYNNHKADNDAWYSFNDLAKNQGLNQESFEVITEDGYKLNVQHVWSDDMQQGAPAVFF